MYLNTSEAWSYTSRKNRPNARKREKLVNLKTYITAQSLWQDLGESIEEKETILVDNQTHTALTSLEQVKALPMPVVVETVTDDRNEYYTSYRILTAEEVAKLKVQYVNVFNLYDRSVEAQTELSPLSFLLVKILLVFALIMVIVWAALWWAGINVF